jgi:DMSO/TMAO reductase YedYZ molybdopterin-dependent catalytic subunit
MSGPSANERVGARSLREPAGRADRPAPAHAGGMTGPEDAARTAPDASGRIDDEATGSPVGRRTILALLGLGTAGVLSGKSVQNALSSALAPVELRDPTGLISLIPVGDSFRFYSVTGSVPAPSAQSYRLAVGGLVRRPASYSLAQLRQLPQLSLVRDFHCVTGWRVRQVPWVGVPLADLLEQAAPLPSATAVRFRSFDGTYTESLTLEQAGRADVIVALQLYGGPISHNHGGPVRMYVASMYGYKSTKWLSGIELTSEVQRGYWENRGYAVDGYIQGQRR